MTPCNCISETADMLADRLNFTEASHCRPHKDATLLSVRYVHEGITSTGQYSVMMPFTVRWQLPNGNLRSKEIPVRMNYCPFCGRSLQPPVKKSRVAKPVQTLPPKTQKPPLPPAGAGW